MIVSPSIVGIKQFFGDAVVRNGLAILECKKGIGSSVVRNGEGFVLPESNPVLWESVPPHETFHEKVSRTLKIFMKQFTTRVRETALMLTI